MGSQDHPVGRDDLHQRAVTVLGKPVFDEVAEIEQDDFLAFWRTQTAAADTKRILGVVVVVPTDVPLRIEHQALLMQESQDVDEIRPLLADLFGADHLDTWIANGATARMLQVIIAWGMANATGTPTSFERAVELAAEAQAADAAGKALPVPNRAARRAPSGTGKSANTGRSSSRTSAASTTSRRKASRS